MSKPMFQRRHYEAVAMSLKKVKMTTLATVKDDTWETWKATVNAFCVTFRNDNSQFKPAKFVEACGMEE